MQFKKENGIVFANCEFKNKRKMQRIGLRNV